MSCKNSMTFKFALKAHEVMGHCVDLERRLDPSWFCNKNNNKRFIGFGLTLFQPVQYYTLSL